MWGVCTWLLLLPCIACHMGPEYGAPCARLAQSKNVPAMCTTAVSGALRLRGGEDEGEAKQPFNLDGWKRTYSNTDDTGAIMPQFWTDYAAEEEGKYSIWFVNYKNNEEYTKKLMAVNLIGGWFQRLDGTGSRKVAFGNVHVFGQEPTLEIAGVFLVAGTEIPTEFKEVADYEQWDWVKADVTDEGQRKVVEDFWRWDGDFKKPDGASRTWLNGKTYK